MTRSGLVLSVELAEVRNARRSVLQLEKIQLRLLRNYFIDVGSQERVCLDYLRTYGALHGGLDFGLRTCRDPRVAGKYDSVR